MYDSECTHQWGNVFCTCISIYIMLYSGRHGMTDGNEKYIEYECNESLVNVPLTD